MLSSNTKATNGDLQELVALIYIQISGKQVLHCQYVVNINFNGKSCFVSLMECLSLRSVFFAIDGADGDR